MTLDCPMIVDRLITMRPRKQIIRLSIYTFLHFTPASSYLTILTQIFDQQGYPGVGPICLATIFTFFLISSVIAPAIRWPLKTQFLITSLCFTLAYISAVPALLIENIIIKFTVIVLGSSLSGLSTGILFVSQGRYVHIVCEKYRISQKTGQMYGILNGFYCLSNVSAGLITTFGLGFFNPVTYFYILAALGFLAVSFCYLFVRDTTQMQQATSEDGLLSPQVSPREDIAEAEATAYNVWSSVKETFAYTPSMYAVLTMMLMDGLAYGVYASQIPKLVPPQVADDMVFMVAGIIMISLGVGSVVGGFTVGIISDKIGSLNSGKLALSFWLVCCAMFVAAVEWPNLGLGLMCGFTWGFSMFYLESWLSIIISRNYRGLSEAFSVNKQFNSFFFIVFQIAVFATDNDLPLQQLMIGLASLVVPGYFLLLRIPLKVEDDKIDALPSTE